MFRASIGLLGIFLIVVIGLGGLVVGVLGYDKVTGEKVAAARTELSGCQADLAYVQSEYSDCASTNNNLQLQIVELNTAIGQLNDEKTRLEGEMTRLEAEKTGLQNELANTNSVLSKTRSDLAGALASDYAINGLIAMGCVVLGIAIALTIPFALYIGGIITIDVTKGS